jgi:hypothetical protein
LALILGVAAPIVMPAQPVLAVDLMVNRTGDASDGDLNDNLCDSELETEGKQCTLRAAIEQANAIAGPDEIRFRIPGTGRHTISPNSELPHITDTVTIDGYTEPGSSVNTAEKGTNAKLMIEIDGKNAAAGSNGLVIDGASNSVIRGLVLHSFEDPFGSGGRPIAVEEGNGNRIEGNFIGTSAAGTAPRPVDSSGIWLSDDSNTVGGKARAARNLIGNGPSGIIADSNNNTIRNNLIGTDKTGKSPLGNGNGIYILFGNDNRIRDNLIAFNFRGVFIEGFGDGNSILSNSIFANDELGIDLDPAGPTSNDADMFEGAGEDDTDNGANLLQNYPVLTKAVSSSSGTQVAGHIESGGDTPDATDTFKIQFFLNPTDTAEGKTLLATRTVIDDGTGLAEFEFEFTKRALIGSSITATATLATPEAPANTSEFSPHRTVRRPEIDN